MSTILTEPVYINNKLWLPPRPNKGGHKPKIMIITSHPGVDELKSMQLLGGNGGSAQELLNALEYAGIPADQCWITSMVKHGLGSKSKPSTEQISEGAPYLDAEIEYAKPELIIAMGAEVYKRVMKKNEKMGDYIGEVIDSPYGKVLPCFSAGMVFAMDPTKRPRFREIFELAAKYVLNKLKYDTYRYQVIDDVAVAKLVVQHYIDNNMLDVGYDAEWCGPKFTDSEVMFTFQFSCQKDVAIILDISKDGVTENRELLATVAPLLQHPKARRMGWNIRADDKRLTYRGISLPDETLFMDGMKAMAFFDSRWDKGLESGIRKFTNYAPYYNAFNIALKNAKLDKSEMSMMKFINPELFYDYAGGDAVAHREACLNIAEKFPKKHWDFFQTTYLQLSNYLLDLELTGIPIDKVAMLDMTNKYMSKYEELRAQLLGYLAEMGVTDFNPNSSKQKAELLFKKLMMKPAYYTKSGKTKPAAWWEKQTAQTKALYNPSTNGKSLSTMVFGLREYLAVHPEDPVANTQLKVLHTMLSMNRVGVFANKFLSQKGLVSEDIDWTDFEEDEEDEPLKQSYWAATCNDGRIHSDFYECLKNFRSSSRVNVQNPASKVLSYIPDIFVPGYAKLSKEDKKKADQDVIPKNLRNIFYAGHPDWRWAEVDVAGADLMIAAYLSKDKAYIHDMLEGGFHLKKAREYFRDPNISKDDYSKYVSGKSITFRVAYTSNLMSAAMPIQSEIFAESGHYLDQQTIEFALQTWERYDDYMAYRRRCNAQAEEYKYIDNARGMRLYFEDTDNWGIKGGYSNESLAYPIASELALFMWDIGVQMRQYLKAQGVWMKYIFPVNTVHDAHYWVIHKDIMADNFFPEVCKYFFTDKVRIATGDALGLEMVVADRWKGKQVDFSKETKWNFNKGIWEWKD